MRVIQGYDFRGGFPEGVSVQAKYNRFNLLFLNFLHRIFPIPVTVGCHGFNRTISGSYLHLPDSTSMYENTIPFLFADGTCILQE